MLDEIFKFLCESADVERDANGRPVYSLSFQGTEEEYEAIKKRLLELDPEQS